MVARISKHHSMYLVEVGPFKHYTITKWGARSSRRRMISFIKAYHADFQPLNKALGSFEDLQANPFSACKLTFLEEITIKNHCKKSTEEI